MYSDGSIIHQFNIIAIQLGGVVETVKKRRKKKSKIYKRDSFTWGVTTPLLVKYNKLSLHRIPAVVFK